MRLLSIPQPFAQLVVRGVKRLEVRKFDTEHRGRIAIHASSAVPSKEDVAKWMADPDMALRFADQGWLSRDDLKALPRSAIIGTVNLLAVHLGKEVHDGTSGHFAWNLTTDRLEVARPDPRTGELVPVKTRVRPLAVTTPADQYAWIFVDPVEFNPITDVDGQQKLWNLDGEIEHIIEQRARLAERGVWRPAEVKPSLRQKGKAAVREQASREHEELVREATERVLMRRELARLRFEPDFERQIQEDTRRYVVQHRIKTADGDADQVRIEPRLRYLFEGREIVGVVELELRVRRRLRKQQDDHWASKRSNRRRETLLALLEELRKDVDWHKAKAKIRLRLEAAADKMLEEEEEDYEFVRRELNPLGAEKAARAKARARAEHEAHALAVAREEARRRNMTPAERNREALIQLIELQWEMHKRYWA